MPRVPIGHLIEPTSGDCYWGRFVDFASNDRYDHDVLVFTDTSTKVTGAFKFEVPSDYSSGATFVVVWTTTATGANDVEWDIEYSAIGGNDTESLDPSSDTEALNQNDTAPSATLERMEIDIAATGGNFAAEDTVVGNFSRDGSDAGDTIAADVLLIELFFEYTAA